MPLPLHCFQLRWKRRLEICYTKKDIALFIVLVKLIFMSILNAQINVDADCYTISFANNPILKPPTDLPTAAGGSLPISVQIRREIKPDDGRVDLRIKEVPEFLLDHMSSNKVEKPAQGKNIGSLEEALRVARNVERVVTPMDLPTNIDKVLTSVRNKLIHLSNYSLDEELPGFASRNPTGKFTIKDFVEEPNYVFDFVLDIPRFVNDQYFKAMTYHLVKFGDVVRQVKDKVDPQTAGLERYVAGEHMDTDNLHIRRWGEVGDGYLGPAFHMRFEPGQVLYGSRRTICGRWQLQSLKELPPTQLM